MIAALANALGLGAQDPVFWMPLVCAAVLCVLVIALVVFDGFDIGVGCLLWCAPRAQRSHMMALLGPWRDANVYWLLLSLGLLVAAFPHAWSVMAQNLAPPLGLLGLGVMLRMVSYEWRMRAPLAWQGRWVAVFALGSLVTALAHGYLLGQIVVGYLPDVTHQRFSFFLAACAVATYALLGASWLVMRQGGVLRRRAARWGRWSVRWAAAGAAGAAAALAFSNPGIFLKWTNDTAWPAMLVLWGVLLAAFVALEMRLRKLARGTPDDGAAPSRQIRPFFLAALICALLILGLIYSFFPYFVPDEITLWDGAAGSQALAWVLMATVVALPVGLVYNLWVYAGMFRPLPDMSEPGVSARRLA